MKFAAWCAAALFLFASTAFAGGDAFICRVERVVDGDTLQCDDGRRVRLWGVDAPELPTPEGERARQALEALTQGAILACLPEGESYGRTVATCYVEVGLWLVRRGLARDCPRYSGGQYAPFEARPDLPRRRSCEPRR